MKKLLSILLAIVMIVSAMPVSFAADSESDVVLDISNGDIELSAYGWKQGDASGSKNEITVKGQTDKNRIFITDGSCKITLDNYSFITPNTISTDLINPISLSSGSELILELNGYNKIYHHPKGLYAAVRCPAIFLEVNASLIIDGSGTLDISSSEYCIGHYESFVNTNITINNGNMILNSDSEAINTYIFTMNGGNLKANKRISCFSYSITGGSQFCDFAYVYPDNYPQKIEVTFKEVVPDYEKIYYLIDDGNILPYNIKTAKIESGNKLCVYLPVGQDFDCIVIGNYEYKDLTGEKVFEKTDLRFFVPELDILSNDIKFSYDSDSWVCENDANKIKVTNKSNADIYLDVSYNSFSDGNDVSFFTVNNEEINAPFILFEEQTVELIVKPVSFADALTDGYEQIGEIVLSIVGSDYTISPINVFIDNSTYGGDIITGEKPDNSDTPVKPDTPDEPSDDVCEDCGMVHNGFFSEIICFFTRIINFIKNLFA